MTIRERKEGALLAIVQAWGEYSGTGANIDRDTQKHVIKALACSPRVRVQFERVRTAAEQGAIFFPFADLDKLFEGIPDITDINELQPAAQGQVQKEIGA